MTSNHFFSFRVLWNRAQILSSWLSNTQKRLVSGKKVWKLLAKEFYYLFIYLAAPGLSCGMWDLRCRVWHL